MVSHRFSESGCAFLLVDGLSSCSDLIEMCKKLLIVFQPLSPALKPYVFQTCSCDFFTIDFEVAKICSEIAIGAG
ncbi:hypothetical protein L2E82_05742 [Cichorium intybus]|uniref:Uncharacterized protein n=1 Tax=Cichorium intybus TaxID=13427 RepID=A0ACB9H8W4_CICIN|nr:hypothetical protein L2E82_05742 [Cichorium intybus]